MTAIRTTPPTRRMSGSAVTFGGILASEWIKLRSLRSTWWILISVVAVELTIGFLVALLAPGDYLTQLRGAAALPGLSFLVGISLLFVQLIVVVLGSLSITSEFGTGMIRASFAAVPNRASLLAGKAVVAALVSFVTGTVAAAASWAVVYSVLVAQGASIPLDDLSPVFWCVFGTGAALACTAVFSLGIGSLVRSSAAAIAISVGVLFILTVVLQTVIGLASITWLTPVQNYLLGPAASGVVTGMNGSLSQWQSLLVVLAWAAVPFFSGVIAVRRRDA
ncbi:ABC transporter permease subunit [Leifsonia sp. 2TAF2]|uniref:ABC transporter permease subunit n=1 Tax=Leifsonia sp. 2TAF2 TaxID=3233009 RepID=UPI003F96A61F